MASRHFTSGLDLNVTSGSEEREGEGLWGRGERFGKVSFLVPLLHRRLLFLLRSQNGQRSPWPIVVINIELRD